MTISIIRKIDNLGRLVLPKDYREHYGFDANERLEIIATEEGILIKKSEAISSDKIACPNGISSRAE